MYNNYIPFSNNYYLLERKLMTIIVGGKFDDGIIIGSDSQGTNNSFKSLNEIKILDKATKDNKFKFIYAGSGQPRFTELTIEEIFKIYDDDPKEKKENISEFINICEKAVNFVTRRYVIDRAINQSMLNMFQLSFKEWQEEIKQMPFIFVIGVWCKEEIGLYFIDSDGVAIKIDDFITLGTKHEIADYIVSKFKKIKQNQQNSYFGVINLVFYAIDQVKKHDIYAGGKTQFHILYKDGTIKKNKDLDYLDKFNKVILNNLDKKYNEMWCELEKDYAQDDFLKDLQKVCNPVNKTDKQKSTSNKT